MKRAVVTGMGIVSANGCTVPSFWSSICRGESCIREITRFSTKDFMYTRAGEITGFTLPPGLPPSVSSADIATQFVLAAASEAMKDSGLTGMNETDRNSTAVVLSTNFGGAVSGEKILFPSDGSDSSTGSVRSFSEYNFLSAADHVASTWNLTGPRTVLSLSCSSGSAAIGYALDLIRCGRADIVFAGGYDALSRFAWSGLSVLRTMAKDAVRPFDLNRAGTIFSEGAGVLIIEEHDQAVKRGAHIYAEVAGWGANNNAHHMTAPAPMGKGSAEVMKLALADSGISPDEIDHINAHGTGTKPNDLTETQAIKTVFGERYKQVPVTSIKSSTGHLMGAAGSAEAIASILSIRDGIIPPTINYKDPDPECDVFLAANVKMERKIRTVISNSAGIGGCNAAVVFRSTDR